MKIYTSYFANGKNIDESIIQISIARWSPKWFEGARMVQLAPSSKTLQLFKDRIINKEEYKDRYMQKLHKFFSNPQEVFNCLRTQWDDKDVALLCYEKSGDFCHRHILAKWLSKGLGIEIEEITNKGPE